VTLVPDVGRVVDETVATDLDVHTSDAVRWSYSDADVRVAEYVVGDCDRSVSSRSIKSDISSPCR
jgi:hypothetical protein